jgi:hypothetical protein
MSNHDSSRTEPDTGGPIERLSGRRVYATYRSQLEHEDDLIGMRNGWLIGGESFLFAAYAALLTLPSATASSHFKSAAQQLFQELPWVGIILALLASVSVGAALGRERQLRKEYERDHHVPHGYPALISGWPRFVGHRVALAVPVGMMIAWVIVLLRRS